MDVGCYKPFKLYVGVWKSSDGGYVGNTQFTEPLTYFSERYLFLSRHRNVVVFGIVPYKAKLEKQLNIKLIKLTF